jgi:hypothetical protein
MPPSRPSGSSCSSSALVRSSVRQFHFALASGCPNKIEFEMAYLYLRRAYNSS